MDQGFTQLRLRLWKAWLHLQHAPWSLGNLHHASNPLMVHSWCLAALSQAVSGTPVLGQACDARGHLPQRFEMLLTPSVCLGRPLMPDCAWHVPLQGHRAQRIEMLLLHEFHARKFLLPDKLTVKVRLVPEAACPPFVYGVVCTAGGSC